MSPRLSRGNRGVPVVTGDVNGRILVLAPRGRDRAVVKRVLERAGLSSEPCADVNDLCRKLEEGAGAALVTEEALDAPALEQLLRLLAIQPPWSELPVIICTSARRASNIVYGRLTELEPRANITLMERPVRPRVLMSVLASSLRTRHRQYQVRDLLHERAELLARERQARTAAEEATREKDAFLAILSHELRTPLNAILGFTVMVRDGRFPESKRDKAMETIERNARAQAQVIEDLLDVSRIISHKLRILPRPLDPSPILSTAIDDIREAAQAKGVRLVTVLEPDPGLVDADPPRLLQIMGNLLTNAVKFTPKGGTVCIELARGDSYVSITVKDDGEGIKGELLPFVFDRFRQGEASGTRAHGGLRLGLAIVRELVLLHDGKVEALSDGPGRGATFVVRLPLAVRLSADADDDGTHAPALVRRESIDGMGILVVDDERDARDFVASILEQQHAKVMTASNAKDALLTLCTKHPDVLISDIAMPGEDGYSLIRKVRSLSDAQGGKTPAIALTTYARPEDRHRALEAGFNVYLAKPIEPTALVDVLLHLTHELL